MYLKKESKRLGPFDYLAQGTLYPDVIESAGTNVDPKTGERVAVKIKATTTWVVCRRISSSSWWSPCANCLRSGCARWAATLVSLKRSCAASPFPGPGPAIRILGEVTDEKLDCLRDRFDRARGDQGGRLYRHLAGLCRAASRALCGRDGRKRTYAWPIVLRVACPAKTA